MVALDVQGEQCSHQVETGTDRDGDLLAKRTLAGHCTVDQVFSTCTLIADSR